jgi:two-component system sensor histidine kinase CiaH
MFGRARLTLAAFYAAAMAITLLAVGGIAYVIVSRSLDDDINSAITATQASVLHDPGRLGSLLVAAPLPAPQRGHDDEFAASGVVLSSDVFFISTQSDGAVISNPRGVDVQHLPLARLVGNVATGASWSDVSADGHRYRILTSSVSSPQGVFYLHVGRSLDARDSQLQTLALVFGFGGLAAVVISAVGGLWLAGRALVPIRTALETQRRFVSDASHELRTPIAVVRANNELLLRHPESTVESNFDQVEAIAGETEHMTRLVEDLLTLARADEGRMAIAHEPLDLGALVEEVTRDMGALAEVKGLELTGDCSLGDVNGDPQRLRQLAVILIDNALKYTPAGGRVRVTCRRAGRRVELRVSDTGPGISSEHQKHIFDRFYRVDASRARAAGGSGLGLAIARWIVEAHHGRLTVESVPGDGSTFVVRLPVRE